jgi:hypothetical protein
VFLAAKGGQLELMAFQLLRFENLNPVDFTISLETGAPTQLSKKVIIICPKGLKSAAQLDKSLVQTVL